MKLASGHLQVALLGCLLFVACADSSLTSTVPSNNNSSNSSNNASADMGGDSRAEPDASDLGSEEDVSLVDMSGGDVGGEPGVPVCVSSVEVCDGVDNDCNGRVDEVGCACLAERSCYLGPAQTRGVGACRDGGRVCDQRNEFFQDCGGGVFPVEELCLDGIDNDCDGEVDEAPCVETCASGEERVCYTGPQQAAGVGECFYGHQECSVEGVWNACRGARLPETEACGDGVDNDCDGVIDVDCAEHLPLVEGSYQVGASENKQPVDFVVAIDNSRSMTDTVGLVEENLGVLARRMVASGIDFRFVLISEKGTDPRGADVCVPEPLAGPDCGNTERFLHVDKKVSSRSAFQDMISCYEGCNGQSYRDFVRSWAFPQLLVVSDNDSELAWTVFRDRMRPLVGDFNLNGVVGTIPGECVAAVGHEYLSGISETGGEMLHICDRDWGVVIDVIFEATLAELQEVFSLERRPVLDTLRVFVQEEGGLKVEQFGNWRYQELGNLIRFLPNLGPSQGDAVLVSYRTLDE